ncbi:hypothetical protein [Actinoplanes sp. NPDC051494]|uniref:hypothetical protein n=1 Tax=Actinoplanes sp. NPDC051494 TaxID=3363907 RepID=UPI00379CA55A
MHDATVHWKVQVHGTRGGREPFTAFLDSLDPYRRAVLAMAIRTVLARQGHHVCGTEWGRALGQNLYEFRVRRELATICHEAGIEAPDVPGGGKVLLRVFFAVYGDRIVLLLGGYDKGADPSDRRQQKEIRRARALLTEPRRHV